MKSGGRGIADGRSRFTLGKALVIGQVALSFALIVAAGLLLGTFRNVMRIDPGFASDGVLLTRVDLQGTGVAGETRALAKKAILERLRTLPGVQSASASHLTPISGHARNGRIAVDGYSPPSIRDAMVFYNAVSDDFLATMGTRLVAGRDIQPSDTHGAPRVALINQAMARKFFGTSAPVGREFTQEHPNGARQTLTVIGVVEDAKYRSLREEPRPTAYVPMAQDGWATRWITFAVRTDGDLTSIGRVVAGAIVAVHPAITLESVPFSRQVASSVSRERLLATLAGFFGVLAIAMAVIGLYGTISYSVARRRAEIGVRIALGAAPGGVVSMILREAGWLIALGLAGGLGVAVSGTRWLESLLFGVTPTDARTMAVAALSLAAVALTAAALPAWRAARFDPVAVLRTD
jgi:predicted permease